jgi:hypothetical protein
MCTEPHNKNNAQSEAPVKELLGPCHVCEIGKRGKLNILSPFLET